MKLLGNACYVLGIVVALGIVLATQTTKVAQSDGGADSCYMTSGNNQCSYLATTCTGTYVSLFASSFGNLSLVEEKGNQCGGSGCTVPKKTLATGCGGG